MFSVYNNQSASDAARFAIYNPQEAADGAKYSIFESFTAADHAKFKLFNGFAAADAGLFRMFIPVESGDQGFYRIANDALVRFGLFVGVDAAPNFDAAPATSKAAIWDSSNHRFVISGGSLSRSLAAPVSGTTDYHLVLRLQNAWGLWSENLAEQIITLNADGEVPAVKPSAGIEVKLTQSSFDTATLTARYLYLGDGDNAADYWQIYLTTNGSDPDVGTDEPAYVPMLKSDGAAKLSYDRSSLTPGTVVKVILRTLRGSDQTPSTASPIITLTILGTEPDDISRADVFQGSIAQQIQ